MGQIQQSINQALNTASTMGALYKGLLEDKVKTQMEQKAKEKAEAEAAKRKAEEEAKAKTLEEINAIELTDDQKTLASKHGISESEYKENIYYSQSENLPEEVQEMNRQAFEAEEIERRKYEDAVNRGLIKPEKSEEKMTLANSAVSPQLKQKEIQRKSFNKLKDAKKRRAGGIKF